jgi:hypothetical protein
MSKTATPDRRVAVAGESFNLLVLGRGYEHVTVKPKAAGTAGQWVCVTCGRALENGFAKDTHCAARALARDVKRSAAKLDPKQPKARHVLAWRNFETGDTEEP